MRLSDQKGNIILSEKSKKGEKFYLYLQGAEYRRLLGELIENTLFIKRDREKHLHHKTNAYGFNNALIHNLEPSIKVVIKESKRKLKLTSTIEDILKNGKYLFFMSEGFEKQIFMPLSLFKQEL